MPLGRSTARVVPGASWRRARQGGERLAQAALAADAEQPVDDQVRVPDGVPHVPPGVVAGAADVGPGVVGRCGAAPRSTNRPPAALSAAAPPWCSRGPAWMAVTAAPRRGEQLPRVERVPAVIAGADEEHDPRAVEVAGFLA